MTPQDIQFKVVSEKAPQESELHDAEFAWLCVKHVKSNATVIAKVGIFSDFLDYASMDLAEHSVLMLVTILCRITVCWAWEVASQTV